MQLGINWRGFKQTECDTATRKAYPFIMPETTVLLKSYEDAQFRLKPFNLKQVYLLTPKDPTTIFPIQYEFAFSLLGMDILEKFSLWRWDYPNQKNTPRNITMTNF